MADLQKQPLYAYLMIVFLFHVMAIAWAMKHATKVIPSESGTSLVGGNPKEEAISSA